MIGVSYQLKWLKLISHKIFDIEYNYYISTPSQKPL